MRSFGFTLIELLITLSILAIMLAVGLPNFSSQIQNSRVKTAMLSLQEALQLTRVQAVSANRRATIKNPGDWKDGWEIFIDCNNDGTLNSDENVIQYHEKFRDVRIAATGSVKSYVSYVGTGEGRKANGTEAGAFQAGTFTICPDKTGTGYELTLARGGRVRMNEINAEKCEAAK